MEYEIHEAAEVFPLMEGPEFDALVADVGQNGLLEPVILYEGLVLDGRNRLRACMRAGVEPKFREINLNGISPVEYVISKNIHRRHLTPAQRAALALLLLPKFAEEARATRVESGKTFGTGRPKEVSSETSEPPSARKAAARAANVVGVGTTAVETALAIQKRDPAVLDRMRAGDVNVAQAAREVGLAGRGNVDQGTAPIKQSGRRDSEGRTIPIYYGKGDKWKEAVGPLIRYLTAWERRDYEFRHVNSKEARRRLIVINEIKAKLDLAARDLEARAHEASLGISSRKGK